MQLLKLPQSFKYSKSLDDGIPSSNWYTTNKTSTLKTCGKKITEKDAKHYRSQRSQDSCCEIMPVNLIGKMYP